MSDFRCTQKVVFTTIDVSEMYRLPRYTPKTVRNHSTMNRCSTGISGCQRQPSRYPENPPTVQKVGGSNPSERAR